MRRLINIVIDLSLLLLVIGMALIGYLWHLIVTKPGWFNSIGRRGGFYLLLCVSVAAAPLLSPRIQSTVSKPMTRSVAPRLIKDNFTLSWRPGNESGYVLWVTADDPNFFTPEIVLGQTNTVSFSFSHELRHSPGRYYLKLSPTDTNGTPGETLLAAHSPPYSLIAKGVLISYGTNTYELESSSDLVVWHSVGIATNGPQQFGFTEPPQFFRGISSKRETLSISPTFQPDPREL